MIAACPKCGARYRIQQHRIKPEGVRLRCARCGAAFRVRAPAPASREPERPAPPAPQPRQAPVRDPDRSVVLADADPERGKRIAAALMREGLEVVLAHDGVEAILTVQRVLPRAVILDAALPRMFGFQICELMKRNDSLRHIGVILVGSVHDPQRYRRPPNDLYGADAYLEQPQLPEAALVELRRLGVSFPERATQPPAPPASEPVGGPPPRPEAPRPRPQPVPAAPESVSRPEPSPGRGAPPAPAKAEPSAPPRAPTAAPDRAVDPEIAKAERLARIIVSDIVLYNEQKFAAAVAAGNVLEAMDAELEEGRGLFRERIPAQVRQQRDFLGQEMLRVAQLRSAR